MILVVAKHQQLLLVRNIDELVPKKIPKFFQPLLMNIAEQTDEGRTDDVFVLSLFLISSPSYGFLPGGNSPRLGSLGLSYAQTPELGSLEPR
jgi:hypothetical protein